MDNEHFQVRIMVQTSSTFYIWIFQFCSKIRIMEPEGVKQEYCTMLKISLKMHYRLHKPDSFNYHSLVYIDDGRKILTIEFLDGEVYNV